MVERSSVREVQERREGYGNPARAFGGAAIQVPLGAWDEGEKCIRGQG